MEIGQYVQALTEESDAMYIICYLQQNCIPSNMLCWLYVNINKVTFKNELSVECFICTTDLPFNAEYSFYSLCPAKLHGLHVITTILGCSTEKQARASASLEA